VFGRIGAVAFSAIVVATFFTWRGEMPWEFTAPYIDAAASWIGGSWVRLGTVFLVIGIAGGIGISRAWQYYQIMMDARTPRLNPSSPQLLAIEGQIHKAPQAKALERLEQEARALGWIGERPRNRSRTKSEFEGIIWNEKFRITSKRLVGMSALR
jgi:hypothetical protein